MCEPASAPKRCARCQREKPRDLFNRKAAAPDGLQPYCKRCQRAARYEWTYGPGVDPDHVDAQAEAQKHRCLICDRKGKLVIDHCHDTGRVRGLLCHNCNIALGHARDCPLVLRRMAHYVLDAS